MCTVTWEILEPSGYRLLFNRDEMLSRPAAEPPKIFRAADTQVIMPTDPQAGGTWISTNAQGVSVCLINNFGADMRLHRADAPSRGQLVREIAASPSRQQALERFLQLDPKSYNPFDLFVFDAQGRPIRWRWNGVDLYPEETRENFDIDRVIRNRRDLYHQWRDAGRDLVDYHRSHLPRAGSYSVCMHRDNAGTQSLSEIRVNEKGVVFTYWPGPPCSVTALPKLALERKNP